MYFKISWHFLGSKHIPGTYLGLLLLVGWLLEELLSLLEAGLIMSTVICSNQPFSASNIYTVPYLLEVFTMEAT